MNLNQLYTTLGL